MPYKWAILPPGNALSRASQSVNWGKWASGVREVSPRHPVLGVAEVWAGGKVSPCSYKQLAEVWFSTFSYYPKVSKALP